MPKPKKGRECKVAVLERTNPEAFSKIKKQIKKGKRGTTSKFLKELNQKFDINITDMNLNRYKAHTQTVVIEAHYEALGTIEEPEQGKDDNKSTKDKQTLKYVFPDLSPQHEQVVINYRNNGYKDKLKALKSAGFASTSTVRIYERPEVKAAIYQMKAVDFNNLRITGDQIIAGIGKIAHSKEFLEDIYEENGDYKPMDQWPEEAKLALTEIQQEVQTAVDQNGEEVKKIKYKYKFESSLKAFQELRKHHMEMEEFRMERLNDGGYKDIIERLLSNKINPHTAGLELDKIGREPSEALKIAMRKAEPPEVPTSLDSDDLDISQMTDEELERISAQGQDV